MATELGLVFIKPDECRHEMICFVRNKLKNLGSVIIIEEREMAMSYEQACIHYDKNDAWCERFGLRRYQALAVKGEPKNTPLQLGREILENIRRTVAGQIYVFIIIGEDTNRRLREVVGDTDPALAKAGTIRYESSDSFKQADIEMRPVKNIVHASESESDAFREIANLCPDLSWLCSNKCEKCNYAMHALSDAARECE